MQDDFLQRLVNLGIAKVVDGYSESKSELIKFETKYGISSSEFYDEYYKSNFNINITDDDVSDWIFSCNCFISSGGDLKKFELNQLLQSLIESQEFTKNSELKNCKESEECINPRFYNGLHNIRSILKLPLNKSRFEVGLTTIDVSPLKAIICSSSLT